MPGSIEAQVKRDVQGYGQLHGVAPSLAETAYALARALDEGAGLATAAVARELRATLQAVADASTADDGTGEVLAGLGSPVGAGVPPEVGNAANVEPPDARP